MKNLAFFEGLNVAWSEKKDGPMNFVEHEHFDGERRANRAMFFKGLNVKTDQTVCSRLRHLAAVEAVAVHNPVMQSLQADALITDKKHLALTIPFGDSPPVIVFDQLNKIFSVMHCGRKPLAAGIVKNTLNKMKKDFNSDARYLRAYVGPGVCKDCYEVDRMVTKPLNIINESIGGKMNISLRNVISEHLQAEGLSVHNIGISHECTAHTLDENGEEKYFSWRREKSNPLKCQMLIAMMTI